MNKYLQAERELALLLGWTALQDANGAWVGTPPQGDPECRGQALVPMWARDSGAAFGLMVEHNLDVQLNLGIAIVNSTGEYQDDMDERYIDHDDKASAVRFCIVQAVISKLNGE